MKLDQLQHLVAIVEHGSLRAAARRLAVPQPALTRSVRALRGPAISCAGQLDRQRGAAGAR
jgi:hypothetical protein